MAHQRSESSATRKELNRNVRLAVKRFDLSELDDQTWDFLCECGAEECQEWVTLRLAQCEALHRADEPILASGHTLSQGQRLRRKARRLVDDARALEAQAEHQVNRARRNLERKRPD